MSRLLIILVVLLCMGCRDEDQLSQYLGSYYGGFDTALTADPTDDLNPNECSAAADMGGCETIHSNPLSHLLMKLDRDSEGNLTLNFYRNGEDYASGKSMYLSHACQTSLGPASDYQILSPDESLDETQVVATARFPLVFGKQILACTNSARFSATSEPHMDLTLQVNPVSGASAISVTLERSRRGGNYLYVKQDGEKVPVKLDLQYVGTDRLESRRLCAADGETQLENKGGYEAVCVMTGREEWRVVLPISPFGPGVTAFWGSTRSPKWYRTSNEPDLVTYHKAVFLPVRLDDGH